MPSLGTKFSSLLPCSCEPQAKQTIQIHLKILVNFVSQVKFGLRYFVKSDGKFDVRRGSAKFKPARSAATPHVVGVGGLLRGKGATS